MLKITDKHIFFYTEWPSNFQKVKFTWKAFNDMPDFFCTEQAFMWAKAKYFGDEEIAAEILKLQSEGNTPMNCKNLGRQVKGYDDKAWSEVRYDFMYQVNLCKYIYDQKLRQKILNPEFSGKTFVEASPIDKIWGIGLGMETDLKTLDNEKNWKGTNFLGKVLTDVRDYLVKNSFEV